MRRVIISISAALVILSVLFYLLNKNIITFRNTKIKDIVGKSVESEYEEKAKLIAIGVKRKFAIEDKKIDFLMKGIDLEKELSSQKGFVAFNDYVESQEMCERIRIVDRQAGLLFSTSENDVIGSKLNQAFYGPLFTEGSALIINPLEKEIIFSKDISTAGKDSYRALFYYSGDLLQSLFQSIETLNYKNYQFAQDKLILLNFPEITSRDEANVDRIVDLMSEKSSGALRVEMKSADVTVYYEKVAEPYDELTVGLAVATQGIGVSKAGVVILISQAFVVLALLIFVFIIIRQKRGIMEKGTGKASEGEYAAVEKEEEAGLQGEMSVPGEMQLSESEVIPLSDVEEVSEVAEIGEGEVAEESTGLEEFETGEARESPKGQPKSPGRDEKEIEEQKDAGDIEETDSTVRKEKRSEERHGDRSFEDRSFENKSFKEKKGSKSDDSGGRKAQSKSASIKKEEAIERDSSPLNNAKSLPELETLVDQTGRRDSSISDVEAEKKGPDRGIERLSTAQKVLVKKDQKEKEISIPEDLYRKKKRHYKDDELAHLIDTMKEVEQADSTIDQEKDIVMPERIQDTVQIAFDKFLKNIELSSGALLLRDKNGIFTVSLSRGLNEKTVGKLKFNGKERVYKNIIAKGKLLFIKEDAFLDNEIRNKFAAVDASRIGSLFFAPVGGGEDVRGIVVVCITMEEKALQDNITKEIRKIIKIIDRYI